MKYKNNQENIWHHLGRVKSLETWYWARAAVSAHFGPTLLSQQPGKIGKI